MTTLSFKPRVPPGQGHERMGQEVKITPQVKLSFSPGRPPTLDPAPNPAPAPAKPRGHRSSWPGQMWSHLTSMFTMQPVVNWVNPQLVTECPPPPLALYTGPPSHQYMPPPAVTPGGGLWHPAPPGNQQQQQMMDPLLMLQGGGTGGGYLGAKMGMNCAYPNAKMGTSDCFPGTKLGSNGYYPSPAYLSAKTDTNNSYPGTKMTTNGYYPSTKMEADCVYPNAEMGINGYVLVAKAVPESYLGPTTTTTTSSKPLNPYAEEWVPPGYYSNTPATPVVLKAPHHLQESTPVIPYSPQDFQNAVIEDALSAGTSTSTKAMDSQNMTQMDPVSATSPQESPGHSMGSESPLGYQEESHKEIEAKEGPSLGPGVQEIAEEGERGGESASPQSTASPGQENVCFGVPAYPDYIKIGEPDLAKCGPSSDTSSQSPEEVQVCFKVPASSECIKITKSDLTKSSPGHNMRSESPERVRVCVAVPSEQTLSAKGVPDSAKEVLGSSMSAQSAGKVPCSATQNQRVLDSETPSSSAEQVSESATGSPITAMSYARVVERATPSPPLPTKDEKCKRDRTPPRGVPAPAVGTCKILELFRRPSKDQRTRSRQFLQELKESSGGGGDWCSSFSSSSSSSPSSVSSSSSSSFSDLSQIYNSSHIPSSSSQPLPPSSSSSSSFPSSSPVPISPLHPPRLPKSTPPMTPTSPGRERSESESSAASLDIDFADDVDCAAVTPVSAVPCAAAKKPINRFLACILGSGESDSEEEEEEEDEDDWDEVCVTDSAGGSANGVLDLDDSWETFGLEMIVLQCRKDPAKEECRGEVPENECQAAKTDDQTDGSNLSEVNARWEREVSEGVPARSATRVRFGGTTVHPMVVWGHAYRKARSGPWEQQARDRARFRQRIGTVETELAPILEASHRTAVYERLFGTTTTTTTPTTGS